MTDDQESPRLAQQSNVLHSELRRRFVLRSIYLAMGFIGFTVGLALLLLGYSGVVDFHLRMGSVFEARLGNAAPGLVIAVLGVVYSWIAATGFKIESSFRDEGLDSGFTAYGGQHRR